jgi:hypothetical protein
MGFFFGEGGAEVKNIAVLWGSKVRIMDEHVEREALLTSQEGVEVSADVQVAETAAEGGETEVAVTVAETSVEAVTEEAIEEPDAVVRVEVTEVATEVTEPEAVEPEAAEPEAAETEAVEEDEEGKKEKRAFTKEVIVGKVEALVTTKLTPPVRKEIEFLKEEYFRIRRKEKALAEVTAQETATEETQESQHARQEELAASQEAIDGRMTELLNVYKKRKAAAAAEEEQLMEANLEICLQLLEQLRTLIAGEDDFEKRRAEFRQIQARWKGARPLPPAKMQELMRLYQKHSEEFYDLIKMNAEMRDYDFKKNLEAKTALCEAAERLIEEKDMRQASRTLQELNTQWREIGPVAKEYRDSIWERFRTATAAAHQLHQAFFEERKLLERARISVKVSLCEAVEAIDTAALTTMRAWEEKIATVSALQGEWRASGSVEAKVSAKLYGRFRAACDTFFERRTAFFREMKAADEANIAKRRALCEEAEALKESTNWRETAERCAELRRQWKEIPGPARRRMAEALWRRFSTAIDYFFERRAQAQAERRATAETFRQIAKPRLANSPSELSRRRDRLKSDILNYETNLSRFNVSSKTGGGIVQEIERTIERLRDDLRQVEEKILAAERGEDVSERNEA